MARASQTSIFKHDTPSIVRPTRHMVPILRLLHLEFLLLPQEYLQRRLRAKLSPISQRLVLQRRPQFLARLSHPHHFRWPGARQPLVVCGLERAGVYSTMTRTRTMASPRRLSWGKIRYLLTRPKELLCKVPGGVSEAKRVALGIWNLDLWLVEVVWKDWNFALEAFSLYQLNTRTPFLVLYIQRSTSFHFLYLIVVPSTLIIPLVVDP